VALSDEDRKETLELMSDAFVLGIQKFRSAEEEAAAKKPPQDQDKGTGGNNGGSSGGTEPFSFAGFILGK